jgi:exosome complex exonuclease DIS3/RRP44
MKNIGILYLNDKTVYIDNKGNKMKKFKSIINNIECLVKTKRENLHQTYCIIDSNNIVLEYLDDISDDYSKIIDKISLLNWSMKFNRNFKIDDIIKIDLTPNRTDFLNNEIISIDPDGCNDIDDAIHIDFKNNIEIYVHISDPTSYFEINSDIDKELQNRISSVYIDKTHHMLPEVLSTDIISLKKGKLRRAYTFKIIFDTNNINDIMTLIKTNKDLINFNFEFIKTNIIVKENLSYDNFEKMLDNKYYYDIYQIGKQILDGLNMFYTDYDSHKMIEAYMLLCNICASKNCILKRTNYQKNILLENRFNQSMAEYTLEDKKHFGIGNLYYTHFTSPIRRYADMIVHRILYNKLDIKLDIKLDNIVNNINNTNKMYKKVYNIYNLLILMGNLNEIEINGNICDIEKNNLKIIINNRILYINIFDNRLIKNDIINIYTNDNSMKIIYNDKEKEYKIGDNIEIKIYFIKNNINPFKIVIKDIDFFI